MIQQHKRKYLKFNFWELNDFCEIRFSSQKHSCLKNSFVTISVTIDGLVFPLDESKLLNLDPFLRIGHTEHTQAAVGDFSDLLPAGNLDDSKSCEQYYGYGGKDSSLDFPVNCHQVPFPRAHFSPLSNDLIK